MPILPREVRNWMRNPRWEGGVAPSTAPTNMALTNTATGVTATLGFGTEGGYPYVDLILAGTLTGAGVVQLFLDTTTGIPALANQVWTVSAPLYVQSGSTANITSINYAFITYDSVPAQIAVNPQAITPGASGPLSEAVRVSKTLAIPNATTASLRPTLRVSLPAAGAVACTLRMGSPLVELAGAASPYLVLPPAGSPGTSSVWV